VRRRPGAPWLLVPGRWRQSRPSAGPSTSRRQGGCPRAATAVWLGRSLRSPPPGIVPDAGANRKEKAGTPTPVRSSARPGRFLPGRPSTGAAHRASDRRRQRRRGRGGPRAPCRPGAGSRRHACRSARAASRGPSPRRGAEGRAAGLR
jgi:hypothetical protein